MNFWGGVPSLNRNLSSFISISCTAKKKKMKERKNMDKMGKLHNWCILTK